MKSYIEITKKYLRVQKKRSVLTVLGIILSVALVTGIGTVFASMFDANLRNTIKSNGDFYAAIPSVAGDKVKVLSQNIETQTLGVAKPMDFAAYASNSSKTDPPYKYLNVNAMDTNAMTMVPFIDVQDGRLPAADGEIVLDYWALKYMPGVKIGDIISLELGTRTLPDGTVTKETGNGDPNEKFTKNETRQFTLVGTLKPPFIADLNFGRAVAFVDSTKLPATEKVTAYIKLKSSDNAQKRIQNISAAAGLHTAKGEENEIVFNEKVLRLFAQSMNQLFNSSMITIISIVVALVVIATIAVIYNAFNISVVERVSQFGLLRCVGATPAQIRKVVFREALILGTIGIPIGVICGTFAMGVVFRIIAAVAPNVIVGQLNLIFSPVLIILSIIIGALTIYLSALLPARKAGKISPMEAVRGTGAIKKEKYRKTDRHRIILKLLGAEGWMAWKNLGRNRKRFYITVLSMVISIILFIVFSSLVGFAYQSGAVDTGDMPSYVISSKAETDRIDLGSSGLSGISGMQGVDYVLSFSEAYADATVPLTKISTRAAELLKERNSLTTDAQGKTVLNNCGLIGYPENELDTVIQKLNLGNMDAEALKRGDGAILVNNGDLYDRAAKKLVLGEMTTLKPGDSIQVTTNDFKGDNSNKVTKQLGILAVVKEGPTGYASNRSGGVYMIVSQKLLSEMAPWVAFPQRFIVMMKQGTDHTAVKALVNNFIELNPNYSLMDMDDMARSFQQTWMVMSIFLYGFVVVISLIGCLNIINTISTNIIIRTRELSVMRAIGMGDGSVRKMVALESILHGAVAALAGSVIGTALSWLLYNSMVSAREFPWTMPWQQILIAMAGAALVAVISGFVPLKRINKGVIMEGIRGEE